MALRTVSNVIGSIGSGTGARRGADLLVRAADEPLGVEHRVLRIGGRLVFRRVADEPRRDAQVRVAAEEARALPQLGVHEPGY